MGRDREILRLAWPAVLLLLVGAALLLPGCSGGAGKVETEEARLGTDQLVQAQRLYAQLQRDHSLHRDRKCLELAGSLLDYYPTFERNDEALSLAVQSAYRLDDLAQALALTDEFLNRFPDSPLVDHRLARGAEIALAARDTLAAARYLIRQYDADPQQATRSDGVPAAQPVLQRLRAEQLDAFLATEKGRPAWPYLAYLQVAKQLDAGEFHKAELVADQMAVLGDDNHWLQLVRERMGGGGPDRTAFMRPSGPVNINRIGVLSPVTGRYAVLGNAFVDACLMALEQANSESGRQFELLIEDTAGDPVNSALAARRLCTDDGSVALFGPMMSDPAASAALVADLYGVPLVSPTATNDRVWQLGERIFQTNLTGFYEVRVLAQLATTVLLKQRFAVIYPDDPEGRRHAEVFTAEVEHFGGQVVAMAAFPPQGTDFGEPILQLKAKRPEVIFAPATVDQMVLLGPQLDFYRAGCLVLGLSNWNSQKLIDRAGTQLERAIFPSDQALIPPQWTAEFEQRWDGSNYPREATALALRAYQSMRMLLDTMATSGAVNRAQLAEALTRRLAKREMEAEGPESFGTIVRTFRNKLITAFPASLFTDSWQLTEEALGDTLGQAGDIPGPTPPDLTDDEAPAELSPGNR